MKNPAVVLAIVSGFIGPCAQADIMHWFWEVEVNGQVVDTSRAVGVKTGDEVVIGLSAEWDSHPNHYFAMGLFAVATPPALYANGEVSIDPRAGYGVNPDLSQCSEFHGTFVDTDGDGQIDLIDEIEAFQLPPLFNGCNGEWRNPAPIYSIGWSVTKTPESRFELVRARRTDGYMRNMIWTDDWGAFEYLKSSNDVLVLVPAPATMALLLTPAVVFGRRRSL